MQYLLPCSCGRKLKVNARQAGLPLTCECGKTIEAPTLRVLRALDPAESGAPAAAAENPWGPRQGVIFLGVVVMLCGLAMVSILWYQRPPYEQPQVDMAALHKSTQEMTLEQSHQAWVEISKNGLVKTPSAHLQRWQDQVERIDRWLGVGGVAVGAGLVMVCSAWLSGANRVRRAPVKKSA